MLASLFQLVSEFIGTGSNASSFLKFSCVKVLRILVLLNKYFVKCNMTGTCKYIYIF